MGVRVDDTDLSWEGPRGMRGKVAGGSGGGKGKGKERREGDWDCPNCGKLVFASKDECFACGEPKPRGGGGGRRGGYDDRDRRRDRRDDYDDRDRGRGRRRSYSR